MTERALTCLENVKGNKPLSYGNISPSFGSSRNLSSSTRKDCVTIQICIGGYRSSGEVFTSSPPLCDHASGQKTSARPTRVLSGASVFPKALVRRGESKLPKKMFSTEV